MVTDRPRHDLYRLIHKGLRAFMTDTLSVMGTLDSDDGAAVADALARVRGLAALCRSHLGHENDFVHPAMEARSPGSAAATAGDHDHHVAAIAALETAADVLEEAPATGRAAAAHTLYRRLAVFVGENLVHMEEEEGRNTAVLWRTHSDAELLAIEGAIVAAQPPREMMLTLRWMVAASTPAERAALLGAVRASAPADAFAGILAAVQEPLAPADRAKLAQALDLPALAA